MTKVVSFEVVDPEDFAALVARVDVLEAHVTGASVALAASTPGPADVHAVPEVLTPEVLKVSVPGDSGGQGTELVAHTGDTVTTPDSGHVGSVTDDGVPIVQPTGDPMDAPAPVAAPSDESASVDEATAQAV